MIATEYHRKRLARLLRTGEARITGRTAHPGPWGDPASTVYYVVEDLTRHQTFHVEESDRPGWARYLEGGVDHG